MDYEKLTKEEYWSIVRGKVNDLFELMQAKNDDYAEGADFFANFRQAEEFGVDALKGLFVRMGDKMSRIKSWSRRGDLKVEGEGLEDALLDTIGYCLLALGYLEEQHRNRSRK